MTHTIIIPDCFNIKVFQIQMISLILKVYQWIRRFILVFIFLEEGNQFLSETVFLVDVVFIPFDLVLKILDPLPEQFIFPDQLFPAFEMVLGRDGLDQAEKK